MNFVIDALSFIAFLFLVSSGVLMHWRLPHGSGQSLRIWDLDRHDWGTLHFWSAMVFLGVLTIHLLLHWKWILAMIRGRDTAQSGRRSVYGGAALILLLILILAPLVSPVKRTGLDPSSGTHSTIRGSTSLRQIEIQTGIPPARLLGELDLPRDLSSETRLSSLKKTYGVSVKRIRETVQQLSSDADR